MERSLTKRTINAVPLTGNMDTKMQSQARKKLSKFKDLYLRIFEYKCIMCGVYAKVLHEIIPISHGKIALKGINRVPLCNKDHTWAQNGTRKSIPILQEKRREFLRKKWQSKKCQASLV